MTTASDLLTMQALLQINSWESQCEPSDLTAEVKGQTREPQMLLSDRKDLSLKMGENMMACATTRSLLQDAS